MACGNYMTVSKCSKELYASSEGEISISCGRCLAHGIFTSGPLKTGKVFPAPIPCPVMENMLNYSEMRLFDKKDAKKETPLKAVGLRNDEMVH